LLVGLIYHRGEAITRDDIEAVKWFRRAADQGDAGAQFYLGLMYSDGHGTPQDYAEAATWFRLSAQEGNPEAQYNLGVLDMSGKAWEPDYVSAYMWFSLAAAYFPASDSRHDTAVTSRDLAAQQLTRGQIAEAQKRARAWAK
jgi:TPR repeat protein